MNINFYFKNIEPTEAIKNYVTEKLQKIEERLHHTQGVNVRFLVEREKQICEISIQGDASMFHVEKSDTDLYAAIDSVLDTLSIQIDKHHKKIDKKNPQVVEEEFSDINKESVSEKKSISQFKADSKPMTNLEAVSQLRLQKYKFFMFHELESKRFSVVYARPDGLFSLVAPTSEFGEYEEHVVRFSEDTLKEVSIALFAVSRLHLSEAITTLEENQLEYLIFLNEDTRRINVLFHEKSGNLALKEPE